MYTIQHSVRMSCPPTPHYLPELTLQGADKKQTRSMHSVSRYLNVNKLHIKFNILVTLRNRLNNLVTLGEASPFTYLYFMNTTIEEKTVSSSIEGTFEAQKSNLINLRKEPLSKRKERLKKLRNWIHINRNAIHEAMYNDFRKPAVEVDGVELFHVLNEIKYASDSLEQWARPTKVDAPITMFGTRSWIQYEARGVCLIISPWNYPFSLCIGPLVSALSAGNSVIIKPSEMTPHVSSLIKKMVDEIFEPQVVSVFEGDAVVSQRLL